VLRDDARVILLFAVIGCGARTGLRTGSDASIADVADVIVSCPPAPVLEAGTSCEPTSPACDPHSLDGGACVSVPPYTASPNNVTIRVGGESATLAIGASQALGGHVYENDNGGLFGVGQNGVYADVVLKVDGDASGLVFHLEGFPIYEGGGVWRLDGALTRNGVTIGRRYTITRQGGACQGGGLYTFTADQPLACDGIDLIAVELLGA
jgi:hypothetical protein